MADRAGTTLAQSLVATCGLLCLGVGGIALFASMDNERRISPPTVSPWVGVSVLLLAVVLFVAGARLREGSRWAALVVVLGSGGTFMVLSVAEAHPALALLPLLAVAAAVAAAFGPTTAG
jgi:hypothetical protein